MIEDIQKKIEDYKQYALEHPTEFYVETWNETVEFLKQNFELSDEREYQVLTAWTFASYFPEDWVTYPYLHFFGPKKSGKTRAQDTLALLAYNIAKMGVSPSAASLARAVKANDEYHTVFVDEFCLAYPESETAQTILAILNAGYKQGGALSRCEFNEETKIWENRLIPVDGFKCLAGAFTLIDNLWSRCIVIRMRKTRAIFSLWMDEKQTSNIQTKLLVVRARFRGEHETSKEIQNKLHQLSGYDGRLVELFYPLYIVSPERVKPIIEEYLRDIGEAELENELASWECEVFNAILQTPIVTDWFSTKAITDKINAERNIKEQVKTRTVGRTIATLGFKPHRSNKLNGWKWNEKFVKKLKERYEFGDVPKLELSTQTPLLPNPQDVELAESQQKLNLIPKSEKDHETLKDSKSQDSIRGDIT